MTTTGITLNVLFILICISTLSGPKLPCSIRFLSQVFLALYFVLACLTSQGYTYTHAEIIADPNRYQPAQINSILGLETFTANKPKIFVKDSTEKEQLLYYPNNGQLIDTDGCLIPDVEYIVKQPGIKFYIRKTGLSYVFEKTEEVASARKSPLKYEMEEPAEMMVNMHRVDINFLGAVGPKRKIESGRSNSQEHFYLAHCPDGITVNGFEKVVLEEMYTGIDLIIYTTAGNLKYDWLVKAGANPDQIKMEIEGASHYQIDDSGSLLIETPMGAITESAPKISQGETQIGGSYKIVNRQIVFSIDDYNRSENLLIDPVREWATYYGGSDSDFADGGCATDGSGNVFVYGTTSSIDFPTSSGAFQNVSGGSNDAYVIKLSASGALEWATHYGGSGADYGRGGCATDGSGNIFFQGWTNSTDFPVSSGALQDSFGGSADAYIVKLNASGTREWATYYGGSHSDIGVGGCATDDSGNVFMHGYTWSTDFPVTVGALQSSHGGGNIDAYIVKLNESGALEWATYYGGSGSEFANGGCATDGSGNVFVHGWTYSTNFPVSSGALQSTLAGGSDAYIVKLNASGTLEWATYYGGSGNDFGYNGCATDDLGNIFVHGHTSSTDFPVSSEAVQTYWGGGADAYIVKLNSSGTLEWATYYGGSGNEGGFGGCATDGLGNVFIYGPTSSTDFPVSTGALQSTNAGSQDAYIVKFSDVGELEWATYYGGSGAEFPTGGCSTDGSGNFFIHGWTYSTNFPVSSGALQSTLAGGSDAYIVKFSNFASCPITISCTPHTLTLSPSGIDTLNPEDIDNGSTVSCGTPILSISQTAFDCSHVGENTVILTVEDENGNTETCEVTVIVNDVTVPVPDLPTLPDITAECKVTTLTPPNATDNCGDVVTGTTDAVLPIYGPGTTVITWTFDDGNGNTSTQEQNLVFQIDPDSENPSCADCAGVPYGPAYLDDCETCIGENDDPCNTVLSGTLIWNSVCGERDATVQLYAPGTADLEATYATTVSADGTFNIDELLIGTFDVFVQVEGHLQKGMADITFAGGPNNLAVGQITNGNVNNEGGINIDDLTAIINAFGTAAGYVNFNPLADLNCDGNVHLDDLTAFLSNYGQSEDSAPL